MHGDIWKHAGHFYHLIDCPGEYSSHRQSGSLFPAVLLEVGSRQGRFRAKTGWNVDQECNAAHSCLRSWRGVDDNKVGMLRVLRSLQLKRGGNVLALSCSHVFLLSFLHFLFHCKYSTSLFTTLLFSVGLSRTLIDLVESGELIQAPTNAHALEHK